MVIPTENAGAESHHSIGNLYKVLVSRGFQTLPPVSPYADQSGSDVDVQAQPRAHPPYVNVARTINQRHREKSSIPSVVFFSANYVFQHNLLKISEFIANFAFADRLAEAPVWG